ncbi:DUF4251 domain-containing protein [Tamlana sp. 2201CG12-4]|uniref:DUF4251 domain-containing protein n=1 Tax=Tamlana sp. 2201CG12-4 TaxID=3112582 RepID=UPI002DBAD1FB|nr:DUF4251 domain-containing protein [Tamlana sp. 2201CG12-4]MEC3908136.1 DUF4251 domain-containing protein [Tamlana sp. 2201CG12-4]
MRTLFFFIAIITITFFSCNSSKSIATQAEIDKLDALIKSKNFTIDSEWAYPMATVAMQRVSVLLQPGNNPNAINLIGNNNYLTIKGDSITSYLPYYGERRMGGGTYGGEDSAIQFKGELQNYKVVQNKDKSYDISFQARSFSENFNVNIRLFTNLKSNISLAGNARSQIRYSGTAKAIEKKE